MTRRALLAALPFALLATATPAALAQPFPSKPVQVIVPFAPGGGLDLNARAFAKSLSEVLGQPVAVDNRAGAAGAIGLQAVAQAAPDGHVLAFTPAVSLTSEPHRVKSIAYGLESFRYVCQVFDNIFAVVVPGDSPYRSVADLIEDARRRPGAVAYGTSGTGSIPHLGTADIEAAAKVELAHVPYKGDAPMLQDLIGGRLGFGAMLASSIGPQLQAGQLRLLAVYDERRHPGFPDVPTLRESGIPVVQASFGGVLAPAGTPPEVVAVLEGACDRAIRSPGYQEWARRANQVVRFEGGAGFERRIREDSRAKAATIRRLGL
jgi:tripartite-type tricarboxylate transporter receptor subunit TctC